MKKLVLTISCVAATVIANAQTKKEIVWPEAGSFRVDTLLSKTNVSKLMIAAGGYGQGMYSPASLAVDYGAYGYARMRFAKFAALSGYINQGLAAMPNGGGTSSHQEATATIYYSKRDSRDQAVKVLEEWKDNYGANGSYTKHTISAPYSYPSGFFSGVGVGIINKKYFAPIDMSNGVIKNTITDSAINFKSAVTQVNTQLLTFGITSSSCAKFKGKIFYTSKEGKNGVYKVRKNTSIDMSLQCLMALHTSVGSSLIMINEKKTASDVASRSFTPQAYKKFGWKIAMVIRPNAVFSINAQMGSLPGVKSSSVKGAKKMIENGYMQIGFGFGIGALDSKRKA
jgi:hypothetical protein